MEDAAHILVDFANEGRKNDQQSGNLSSYWNQQFPSPWSRRGWNHKCITAWIWFHYQWQEFCNRWEENYFRFYKYSPWIFPWNTFWRISQMIPSFKEIIWNKIFFRISQHIPLIKLQGTYTFSLYVISWFLKKMTKILILYTRENVKEMYHSCTNLCFSRITQLTNKNMILSNRKHVQFSKNRESYTFSYVFENRMVSEESYTFRSCEVAAILTFFAHVQIISLRSSPALVVQFFHQVIG